MKLYNYQKTILKEIIKRNGKCIVALSQGLGKTVITVKFIKVLQRHGNRKPKVLIIIPPILYQNWIEHIKMVLGNEYKINSFEKENYVDYEADIYLISYQKFTKFWSEIPECDCIILDEAHWIKNYKSKRTKTILYFTKITKPKFRLALTGTPILNKPVELWPIISFINPNIFPSFYKFAERYCNAKLTKWGYWDFSGAKNLDELKERLQPILVRMTWDDIAEEINIQPLHKQVLEIGKADAKIQEMEQLLSQMKDGLEKEKLKRKQRQLVGLKKIKKVVELTNELLNKHEQIVVFAYHREVVETISKELTKIGIRNKIIYGGTHNKSKIINEFREGKFEVLILNWISGGVGLNLEFCNACIFAELDYVPANIGQAMFRIFRITSKKPVFAYFPYIKGSYEERIIKILLSKQDIIDKLIKIEENQKMPFEKKQKSLLEALKSIFKNGRE